MQEGPHMQQNPNPPNKTNGLAIAALVLGILGLLTCGITGVVGVVLGIVALVQIGSSEANQGGRGMAITGLVVGAVSILILPVYFIAMSSAVLFPVFSQARYKAQQASCMSNLKQLALSHMMYVEDYNDRFPSGDKWDQQTLTYAKNSKLYSCPSEKGSKLGYAMNKQLSSFPLNKMADPVTIVLMYDAKPGSPKSGGPELLPNPGRHNEGNNIAYADGHVKWIEDAQIPQLKWTPK